MKILHIINHMSMGGAQSLLLELVPMQKRMGHEITVLELERAKDRTLSNKLIEQGITVKYVSETRSVRNPINIISIIPYMSKYDIVHSHLFPSNYWVALAKTISFSKVPIITTEHSTTNKRRGITLFKYIDNFIYKRYSKVVACADKALETFKARYPKVKCITIPNGIDISRYINASSYSKNTLFGIEDSAFVVTMVARFDYPKRQDTLVEAITKLPSKFHAVFVGGSKEDQGLLKLQAYAAENAVSDRVHFLYVRSDVPSILKTSDVVVLSSEYEGLSLSSIEGMASGRPFIATDVNGLREVVKGAGELFECGDADQLASILLKLSSDTVYYDMVVRNCIERAVEYDIHAVAEKYISEYKNLTMNS